MTTPVKGSTVLFSEMTPPKGGENAFNDWYDNHHTPNHVQGVPGFLSARRYRSPTGPHYLAIYELSSPEVLEHKEYLKRKLTPDATTKAMLEEVSGFSRYIANELHVQVRDTPDAGLIDADVVIAVLFMVPPDKKNELIHWHKTEHTPMLMENQDWLMVRHMEIYDHNPDPYTHLFLHYVRGVSVLEQPAHEAARHTQWRHQLAEEDWFMPKAIAYQKRGIRFLKNA